MTVIHYRKFDCIQNLSEEENIVKMSGSGVAADKALNVLGKQRALAADRHTVSPISVAAGQVKTHLTRVNL